MTGARMLAPYFGSSLSIWTGIIGVILGSLSFGYVIGGKIADKRPEPAVLSSVFLLAAIIIIISKIFSEEILSLLESFDDIRLASVVSSLLLFAPASIFLGMVSPISGKLALNTLSSAGSTIGGLYAISTIGSIAGTFFTGFYSIPLLGVSTTIYIIVAILIICSVMIAPLQLLHFRNLIIFVCIAYGGYEFMLHTQSSAAFPVRENSQYGLITVDEEVLKNDRVLRSMKINNENSSAMFVPDAELAYEYTKYYRLYRYFNPQAKTTLMIGGGAYSYPKAFLAEDAKPEIDVIEIDSKVTELAMQHFQLTNDRRLRIITEDARVTLNRTEKKYDVIFGDAFSSQYAIPFQLVTEEATRLQYNALRQNGVVITNIISARSGEKSKFFQAIIKTYEAVFDQVYAFAPYPEMGSNEVQNIVIVGVKSQKEFDFKSNDPQLQKYLQNRIDLPNTNDIKILTDDLAPVEYYAGYLY
jgi:spermidine synthase